MTQPWSVLCLILVAIAIILDLALPWYAEQAENTPWHRHHIIERFGLLNIIVLGEVLLSSTRAIEAAIEDGFNLSLIVLAISGAAIAFMMWWLYFSEKEHLETIELKHAFIWSYGHFIVFASGAATGAGLSLMVDVLDSTHHQGEHFLPEIAAWAITIPLALYIVGFWLVRDRYQFKKLHNLVLLFFAVLIGLSALLPYPPVPSALLLAICLSIRLQKLTIC